MNHSLDAHCKDYRAKQQGCFAAQRSCAAKSFSAFRYPIIVIDKDLDTLYASVTEDKTFTHMSGKTQTKEEFFGEIGDGTLKYFDYKIDKPQVRITGDYACLTATTTLTARVYGFSGSWPLRTEAWFQRIGGEWIYCNKPNL